MSTENTEQDARERLRTESEALINEFKGMFSPETVQRYVQESYESLARGDFAENHPVIAARFARERLRATSDSQGHPPTERREILFLCVHNAGRSQMAAALTARLGGNQVNVRSAGSMPASQINPVVVTAMAEVGLDISQEFPKPLTDDVVQAADVVITMGCGDSCPFYPAKRYLDWAVDDPAHKQIGEVRRIRDDLENRVRALLNELGVKN